MTEEDVTVFTCTICGRDIVPENGDEFKHVQDSKTGRNLVFCGEDGTLFAQLIQMDLQEDDELLESLREKVAEKYAESLE